MEAAPLLVREQLDRSERKPPRLEQPAQLAGRDVQLDQPVRDVRVVVEEAGAARPAVAPRAEQAAVVVRERAEHELGVRRAASTHRAAEPVPASASAAIARPFHDAIALSSRPGCGRSPLLEQPRPQLRLERPPDTERPSSKGSRQLVRHALAASST